MKAHMIAKIRIGFLIYIMVIVTLTGCGGEKEEAVSLQTGSGSGSEQSAGWEDDAAETDENDAGENTNNENSVDKAGSTDNGDSVNRSDRTGNEDSTDKADNPDEADSFYNADSATELDGDVRSIGESSVVLSKIFSETTESDEGTVWILSSLGGDNEVLVTVYFEENADYIYKTIRNGGKDVDTREGSFSDIKEGMILLLNGRYVGKDFYADHVEIDNVVLKDAW